MPPSSKSPTSTLIPSLLALASALARFELLLVLSFSRLLLFVLLFSLTMIIVGSLVVLSALLSEFLFSFLSTSTFLTLGDAATDPTPAPITLRSMSAANVIEIVLFMDIIFTRRRDQGRDQAQARCRWSSHLHQQRSSWRSCCCSRGCCCSCCCSRCQR